MVGVGRRPWLQKIATITVAISLTIATADTFRVAKEQYDLGYTDAGLLVDSVVGSTEIKVVRVISDTFLWLAQVQTLIRLFPRHKEKVTIKWLGFALVSFDTIFSILDDFVNGATRTRPRSFQDAIPALAYLFELAISLIYASCVIYYSLSKRRFAFWHPRMRNICLVASLSLIAVLIPIVFFVLDVSKPDVAGWGDYIRWVGAAAASVVVWEWVERIEALERDERKDGILGREIFDGDEMLDGPVAEETDFPDRRSYLTRNGFPSDDPDSDARNTGGIHMRNLRSRIPFGHRLPGGNVSTGTDRHPENSGTIVANDSIGHPAMPPQAVSPVSRSDTTSAGSTIYAVRYHTVQTPTAPNHDEITASVVRMEDMTLAGAASDPSSSETAASTASKEVIPITANDTIVTQENIKSDARNTRVWRSVGNPFKRRRASPPAEVAAQIAESSTRRSHAERTIALRDRLIATSRSRAGRDNPRRSPDAATMTVTVIPAQRRGNRTWSPEENPEQESQRQASQPPAKSPPPRSPANDEGHSDAMPVLIIPAPRRGQRTWSPEDAYTGSAVSSPGPAIDTPEPVISTRGTLTFSEDRQPMPSRRSTYTRSSPVYAVSQSCGPATLRSTPPVGAMSPSLGQVLEQDSARGAAPS